MSATVKAYYDGTAFVPMIPLDIQKGSVFMLSVLQEDSLVQDIAKKVMTFRQITNNLHKINATEPLPLDFDEILSQRINFKTKIDL
jgi:hypothetical protein